MADIKIGDTVEFNPTGKTGDESTGKVLAVSDRKIKVVLTDGTEVAVFKKYATVIEKGKNYRKAKEKAEKGPRKARPAAKAPGVVPLITKDGKDSKSIVAGADLSKYHRVAEVKTPSGRPSFDIGDEVATLLRGKTLDEAIAITAHKLTELTGEKVTQVGLKERYAHLNPGQVRMNLGNRLRAAFRADQAE